MAISSLSKITVPLASDSSSSNQGLLMPKLQYRFRVSLENFGVSAGEVTELTKQVVDVTRPNVSFETMTVDVYNSRVYLAGKHTWEAITLTLRDDATGAVQKLVGEQLQRQFDFMEQSSAASGIDYKFVTRIEILDGGNGNYAPETLDTFELYGCFDSLTKAIKQGMTFIISIWDDQATHMTWLDSGDRGPCQPNFNVRHTSPNVKARFSNIVLEDIVNYPHNECDSQNKCQVKHRQLPLKLVKCVDNPNYRDPYWGDSCTQWASYSCTGQSFSNELMQACPVACKICTPSTQMPVPATPLPIPSTGSTSVSSVNTGSISTTMQSVLNRHNKYRCMHGVPLMTWDPVIAANAQAWADMSMGVMKHSPHTSRSNIGGFWALGENLALGVTDAVAVDLWYSEISNTNGGMVSDFSPSTGHYSQVIWKDSITLGCGVYNKLIVCQYGPAGNSGDYTQVTPPIPGKVCSDGGVV